MTAAAFKPGLVPLQGGDDGIAKNPELATSFQVRVDKNPDAPPVLSFATPGQHGLGKEAGQQR
ncbi:MAG: hypothetical protein ACTSU0_02250 [Alphaproteobacteria bacterium]